MMAGAPRSAPAPSANARRHDMRAVMTFQAFLQCKQRSERGSVDSFPTERACYIICAMSKAASMPALRGAGLISRDSLTAWLLVAPAVACIVVLFIVPIGYVLLLSVTDPTVSLDHYRPSST